MAIGLSIEMVNERFAAVEASMRAALPNRIHKQSLEHFDAHTMEELRQGVVMLTSGGERGYAPGIGAAARSGTQRLVLVVQLQVLETDPPRAIQAEEFAVMEEIKTFVRGGVPGVGLRLERLDQSRQLEHPYGWVLAYLDAGPNESSLA